MTAASHRRRRQCPRCGRPGLDRRRDSGGFLATLRSIVVPFHLYRCGSCQHRSLQPRSFSGSNRLRYGLTVILWVWVLLIAIQGWRWATRHPEPAAETMEMQDPDPSTLGSPVAPDPDADKPATPATPETVR